MTRTTSDVAVLDPRQAARAIAFRQSEYAHLMELAAEQARVLEEKLTQLTRRAKAELMARGATAADIDAFLDECEKAQLDTGRLDASFVDLLERHGATAYPPPYRAAKARWAVVPIG